MKALPTMLRPGPGLVAGVLVSALLAAGVVLSGGSMPVVVALCGVLGWFAVMATTPGAGSLGLQAAGLGIGATALALAGGGVTNPSIAALAWPIVGLAAAGLPAWRGVPVALIGLLVAGGLGPVFVRAGQALAPELGAGLGIGVTLLLAGAALLKMRSKHAGRSAGSASQPASGATGANLDRTLALEALALAEEARADATARARFIAEMSHEIRTPLNAILGFSDTMREGVFGPLPDRYRDYAGLIHSSGTHLLDLVSDLLDLSKVEAGRYKVVLEPVDLAELAEASARIGAGAAAAQDVRVQIEAPHPVPARADGRAVRQMLLNLISNAVKFTPPGGRVSIRALSGDIGPRLEVQDTGVGMSAEQLARVGQPWVGGEDDAKGQRGTGLGLTLVQKLAELQGGRLALASQPGVGTLAVIALQPLQESATVDQG